MKDKNKKIKNLCGEIKKKKLHLEKQKQKTKPNTHTRDRFKVPKHRLLSPPAVQGGQEHSPEKRKTKNKTSKLSIRHGDYY